MWNQMWNWIEIQCEIQNKTYVKLNGNWNWNNMEIESEIE